MLTVQQLNSQIWRRIWFNLNGTSKEFRCCGGVFQYWFNKNRTGFGLDEKRTGQSFKYPHYKSQTTKFIL